MSGINPVGRGSEIVTDVTRRAETTAPAAATPNPRVSRSDLALDVAQVALDIVGIFELMPFADLANTGISIVRGDGWGALASAAGVIPYVGDAAKLGKLGKWAETVSKAIDLARHDSAFAHAVRPALQKVADAIRAVPEAAMGALPNSARQQLSRMSRQLDEALGTSARPPAFTPSRTAPSGIAEGVPSGRRATNAPNADPAFKRGIARENQSADILATRGYRVEQNPVLSDAERIASGIAPGKNPDFRIEGKVFDAYSPQSSSAASVYNGIAQKVGAGQAHRIVVNLADSPVRPGDLQRALSDSPIAGLQEVIVIDRSGGVHRTFPH